MANALGKVGQESTGAWYCTVCGATRTAKNELFSSRQAVIAHLKSCTGISGVQAGVDAVLGKLAAPGPVLPRRLPADLPADPHGVSRQPAGSVPASAMPGRTWAPYRGPLLAGSLPAEQSRLRELEEALAAERDRRTLAEHEAARMKEIAEEAALYAHNHVEHLGQAAAAAAAPNPWPWIVGVGLVAVVGYWLLSGSGESQEEPQRMVMGSSRPQGSAMGKIADKVVNKVVDRALGKALGMVF